MASTPRYEVLDTLAAGDFATVYRARDRELGREVAIKQIHQQFLHDERQLARYWQEAQLLASLQHPNILTIYDIVRSKGWLIVELMRGSLKQVVQNEPIDLDFLRVVLACSLSALQFLHANGVIHGDVKPSNLLLDQQNRIKLGDFGLARRAASEEGSLLKGTTKYMAPELVSNQFGPVGPASDLYSLGFAAYELMCGPQFDALFPTLHTFGRDKQIAWMMWHAAPDRALPEISRVLQGVPADLTRVIQKMVVKDQSQRYQSAQEALRDLRADMLAMTMLEDKKPPAEAPRPKRRRKLIIAAGSCLLSVAAVLAFFILTNKQEVGPTGPPEPIRGIVRDIFPDEGKFILESAGDGKRKEISLKGRDRIFVNRRETQVVKDLRPGDRVTIRPSRDHAGRPVTEVAAFRPEGRHGRIVALKADEGRFTLQPDGEAPEKKLEIHVPATVKIELNGRDTWQNKPVTLDKLKLDDQVVANVIGEDKDNVATSLSILRPESLSGVAIVRNVDAAQRQITFALGEGETPEMITFPYAVDAEVTVNGLRFVNQQLLKPADLLPGDKAHEVKHDTKILRVDVDRVLGQAGVVKSLEYGAGLMDVLLEGAPKPTTFLIKEDCKITLAGDPATLGDLRTGDVVDITHESIEAQNPQAKTISARRPPDPSRWAILLGTQQYEDILLTQLTTPTADVQLMADTLAKRYAVPTDQIKSFNDESLVRLEQAIPNVLGQTNAESKILIYVAGHAYKDDEGKIYYAPKSFNLKRISTTGLALQWLLEQFEGCPAKDKLLLLDCTYAGKGGDLRGEPSTAEMIQSLVPVQPGFPALRTVTAMASCRAGQRGYVAASKQHSVFATCLAEGFAGKADKNRDKRLETTELFDFLTASMAEASKAAGAAKTPVLFLPDARPPRLTDEAKKAIRRLAAYLKQDKFDIKQAEADFDEASKAAGKEVDPNVLFALIQLKLKQPKARDHAFQQLQEIAAEKPDLLVPAQGMAWAQFEKSAYQSGVDELQSMVSRVKPPKKPTETLPDPVQRALFWAGQLREYASTVAPEGRRPKAETLAAIDAAVSDRGVDALRSYNEGRSKTRNIAQDYDKRAANAEEKAESLRANIERRQLPNYVAFPYDAAMQLVLNGLDQ